MKRLFSVLVVLCAAGLSACGDKGADGPVGTWVLDTKAFFDQNTELFGGVATGGPEEQKARAELEKSMQTTMVLKADKSFTGDFVMMGQSTKVAGSWSASGDQVTFTAKTKNGEPVTGKDTKPWTLTVKGNSMSGKPDAETPVTIVLKRA